MHIATRFFVLCLTVSLFAADARAEQHDSVLGIWASKGSVFSITRNDEELIGEVIAMKKPRLDRKNPDPTLRDRPVIGLQVLKGYRFKHGVWRGKLYDPSGGNTFASYLKLGADGNLRLRGYFGFAFLGKTELFEPVSTCSERIVSMLRLAEIDDLC
jgi:uncharacterized protein (DUF2147 family)